MLRTGVEGPRSGIESPSDESSRSIVVSLALWLLASISRRLCSFLTKIDIDVSVALISSSVGMRHGATWATISDSIRLDLGITTKHVNAENRILVAKRTTTV
jgi:hypothetical protein